AINGLNEQGFRRRRHVYWSAPETIDHGRVQRWFYERNTGPGLDEARTVRAAEQKVPLPGIAADAEKRPPAEWTAAIREEARRLGAEAVGIARIDPDWVFEGFDMPWRWVVVLGIAMDYETMTEAPDVPAGVEVVRQYTRGMKISKRLAGWLRQQGHDAHPEHGPLAGSLTLIPAALAAGLGELGKHGSIINRELGSCFRLAAVLTNVELVADAPDGFGADSFCASCQICANHCPPQAILPEKQTVRGQRKWYVDFDKCLPFFNETAGCGICVVVCPFSRPEIGGNLVAKLARRRNGG
ncbi:MAG TPA: 4Fe-4S dicluster domain-containing protein, partial [Lacipirellulaceae bacterium]|nr:4Fe-4S dicluster domain-containing protein [Lacipirellulaceae bacterium]